MKHSQDCHDVRQGSQQVCSRRFGRAYPVKGATFPPFVWGVTINMTQRSASTERLCYQYVSDWQMAFRDRILIFVQALVSTLLHSVSPNRPRILKPSSSTLQQPRRSPESLIIGTWSESVGWPVEPFLTYNLFKHGTRWDLLHVMRWHYTCSARFPKARSWQLMTMRVPQPHVCRVWPELPENEPQLGKEFVWIVGAFRPSPAAREEKKRSVIELGRTRTRFVLAGTFPTLLKVCGALCLSAPATDAVLSVHSARSHGLCELSTVCVSLYASQDRSQDFPAIPQTSQALPTFTHWPRPLHLPDQSDNACSEARQEKQICV